MVGKFAYTLGPDKIRIKNKAANTENKIKKSIGFLFAHNKQQQQQE